MIDLALTFLFLFLFLLSHVVLVRIRLLRFQLPGLLVLSFVWLGIYGLCLTRIHTPENWHGDALVLSSLFLYLLLSLFYIAECTQIDYKSPSLTIMNFVKAGPEGKATYEEIERFFLKEKFVVSRLDDLAASGMISLKRDRYVLTRRGQLVARIFGWYRRCLGRSLGG